VIRYALDLYPRADPKNGARIRRFANLQAASYRAAANGTGSGQILIRGNSPDAAFVDPEGMQYIRVIEVNTLSADGSTLSGFTETVRGGFYLEDGDFKLLDTNSTKRLKFGGAGTLAYMDRAIMWSHTYLFGGMDPFDDTWRLYAQGALYGGDYLGAVLYRVILEAQAFQAGAYTHKHGDGVIYTDTHSDDRIANALPAITLSFSGTVDSSGNPWTRASGEFKARVGESLLRVIQRLQEAGLYVELNPHTFVLSAWEAPVHRALNTKTGLAWGAGVVLFQAPTDPLDNETGNIMADATRAIHARIRRSRVLAGGSDVYGIAADASAPVLWEGFADSDSDDATVNAALAVNEVSKRSDKSDTLKIPLWLESDPTNGKYVPFKDIGMDWLVSVHTGTAQFEMNAAELPVAALGVELPAGGGGGWRSWTELGSAFMDSDSSREFDTATVGSHSHPPKPELCRPAVINDPTEPTIVRSSRANNGTLLINVLSTDPANRVLYAARLTNHDTGPGTADWRPNGVDSAGVQAMTLIADIIHPTVVGEHGNRLLVFRLINPNTTEQYPAGTDPAIFFSGGSSSFGTYDGAILVAGAHQTTPEASTPAEASGTGTTMAVTIPEADGAAYLNFAGARKWAIGDESVQPTAVAPLTTLWADAVDWSSAQNDAGWAGGHGDSTPSWTIPASRNWVSVGIAVAPLTSGSTAINDGHRDLVGSSIRATRCDHRHDVHRDTTPTVNDDWATRGYKLGTVWAQLDDLNSPTAILGVWMLVDITTGAAVWAEWPGGAGSHDSLTDVSADDHHTENHASRHANGGADEVAVEGLGTAETDTALVLAPDGTGGLEFRAETGGGGGGGTAPLHESATVAGFESSSSATFVDLATGGPAVTVVVPSDGKLVVTLSVQGDPATITGFTLSGTNTLAASDDRGLYMGAAGGQFSRVVSLSGLTPGSTTVTMKYRSPGGGSVQWGRRSLLVEGGGGGGGTPAAWTAFNVDKISQSAAETAISHTDNLEYLIDGAVAFVRGTINLTAAGDAGQPIIVTLPALLAGRGTGISQGANMLLLGTARWMNSGAWHRFLDAYQADATGQQLALGQYDQYPNAGVNPSDALASGDSIALHLTIPLRTPGPVSGAASPVSGRVTRTAGDIAITATSFTNVDASLEITLTTGANRVLLGIVGGGYGSAVVHGFMTFSVDGVDLPSVAVEAINNVGYTSFASTHLTDVLSAGSHTFRLRAKVASSTFTVKADTVAPMTIWAVESV
jgi:hypothetical protein